MESEMVCKPQSTVKAAASLFKEKVAQKLFSNINWIGIKQDYTNY